MAGPDFDITFDLMDNDVAACRREYDANGVEGCKRFIREKQEEWKHIPLNVAIIGTSGVGKSSFINAIRDLTADDVDQGAAAVDVVEATTEMTAYPHPDNAMLKFWDLPGVGTDRFPKASYLEAIKVDRYDFFLLMTSTRFTENDTWLGSEIRERKKRFYFVRTKIAVDVYSDRMAHPRSHDEQQVLDRIRQNVADHLQQMNCSDGTQIFLIDNYKKNKFDFQEIEKCLVRDCPEWKRQAMILSLSRFSEEMIRLKAAVLRKYIWPTAVASGLVAAIPVPGVSFLFDATAVIAQSVIYFRQLGLDDESLQKHAKLTGTSTEKLAEIVSRSFSGNFFTIQGMKTFVQALGTASTVEAATVAEEFVRFIPVLGSVLAAALSFGGTFIVLRAIVNKMESVASEVVRYAIENGSYDDEEHD